MDYMPHVYGTFLSLLPPLIAIALALITKEVYSSLFLGIITGSLLYANGNFLKAWESMLYNEKGGLIPNLTDSSHIGILVFVVLLGSFVVLINKSNCTKAFAKFASKHIKTKVGAQIATIIMGLLIFVDDGFNCMSVGTIMRPITDKFGVSRSRLAYIIDSTAAPVCIIAPISSWAAAVSYSLPSDNNANGFVLFLKTIPYNIYAIITILMLFLFISNKITIGKMKNDDLDLVKEKGSSQSDIYNKTQKTSNLLIPVIVLIISCIISMLYTGGFFDSKNIIDSFSNADSAKSLVYGSLFTIIFTFILYMARKVMSFSDFMNSFPEGFKSMCAPMIILIMAWNLSGMTNLLGASEFISKIMGQESSMIKMFIPLIVFLISILLSFSTGTSWGTFTILIPIIYNMFDVNSELLVIAISACLSGSVCGDHCSPLSDTTIMSSAGAMCDHIAHVSTQLPYAIISAIISAVGFLLAGVLGYFFNNKVSLLGSLIAILLLIVVTLILNNQKKKEQQTSL